MNAPTKVPDRGYDLAALVAALGDVPIETDPKVVHRKSRDFFWFSPVLKRQLQDKVADLVVVPRDEADVMRVASAAARHRVPITIRGGGTGNYGQCVPVQGGLILDMSVLSAIEWQNGALLRVGAGRKMHLIDAETRKQGFELRMHPSTKRMASIGGFAAGGSGGIGSIHHLTMALFADQTGIDVLHVPYRAGTAMVNGLLTGEIQVGWSGIPNVLSGIGSGQLRGYCISVLQRSPSEPAIPTCDELGIKGFDAAAVLGLYGPAGTPPQVVTRLAGEAAKVMREPAMTERMNQLGMIMRESGTANYIEFRKQDAERYANIVRKLNLHIN